MSSLIPNNNPAPVGNTAPVGTVPPEAPVGRAAVFISYRSRDPDMSLAQEFHQVLEAEGYSAFMAGESLRLGDDWARRIDLELERCDYFLLLLSEQSAVSEMVTEEVRRAKQLRDQTGKPMLLPIRVNFPIAAPLNYDLRGYLQRIQQREWRTAEDTPVILAEVLALMQEGAARRGETTAVRAVDATVQSEGKPLCDGGVGSARDRRSLCPAGIRPDAAVAGGGAGTAGGAGGFGVAVLCGAGQD